LATEERGRFRRGSVKKNIIVWPITEEHDEIFADGKKGASAILPYEGQGGTLAKENERRKLEKKKP